MKVLVTGSRLKNKTDSEVAEIFRNLYYRLLRFPLDTIFIHGGAKLGIDYAVHSFCSAFNGEYYEIVYKANWNKYGLAAGPIRNEEMYDKEQPDLVLAFWDGNSRGTKHMIDYAKHKGCKVEVIMI